MSSAFLLFPAAVGLSVWAGFSGCSSTPKKALSTDGSSEDAKTDGPPHDAKTDDSMLGISYPCTGGFIKTADAGVVPLPSDAGASPPVNCVVGQSYCSVESLDKAVGVKPEYRCATLSIDVDGAPVSVGLGDCADTPTCACLCNAINCRTECACHDDGGFVIVSCHQI